MKKASRKWKIQEIEEKPLTAKENLLGFFDLLLQIDKRNHPEIYKKPRNKVNGPEKLLLIDK